MIKQEHLILFQMRFDLLLAQHSSRLNVTDRTYLQQLADLYCAFKDYINNPTEAWDKATKDGIL